MGIGFFSRTSRFLLLGLASVWMALQVKPVQACSCMVVVRAGQWWPSSGKVPVNAKGLVFHSSFGHMVLSKIKPQPLKQFLQVEVKAGVKGKYLSIPFRVREWKGWTSSYLVEPKSGFLAGKRYRFTVNWHTLPKGTFANHLRKTPRLVAEVEVSPHKLKSMTVPLIVKGPYQGPLRVARGASCSATIRASMADFSMKLPAAWAVFRKVLFFQTRVNGTRWRAASSLCSRPLPGESWMGRGHDRVFTNCAPLLPGLVRTGLHSVVMEAALPGTSVRIRAITKRLPFLCMVKKRSWWWGLW